MRGGRSERRGRKKGKMLWVEFDLDPIREIKKSKGKIY